MLLSGLPLMADNADVWKLASPGGTHEATFRQVRTTDDVNEVRYSVSFQGRPVVTDSRAGLEMDNWVWEMAIGMRQLEQPASWMDLLEVDSVVTHPLVDRTWTPLYGERGTVRDRYNAATLYLSRKDDSDYRLNIEVRAYDEGIAFRYFLPEHPNALFHKVVGDLTEYTFPAGTMAWSEKWAQARFDYLLVDSLKRPVERALTLELPDGTWAALADADVDDWCLTKFRASADKPHTPRQTSPIR